VNTETVSFPAPVSSVTEARAVQHGSRVVAVRQEGIGFESLVGVLAGKTLSDGGGAELSGKVASKAVAFLQEDDTLDEARAAIESGKVALVFEGGAQKYAFDAEDLRTFLKG